MEGQKSINQEIPKYAIHDSFSRKRFHLLRDTWSFLRVRKKWWLLPIILMMLLVGILVVFGQSSAVSPFVYALF